MTQSPVRPFKPINTRWLTLIITIVGVLLAVEMIAHIVIANLFQNFNETLYLDDEQLGHWQQQLDALETFSTWLYYTSVAAFIISAIMVGKWIFDSQHNARYLQVEHLKYSPAMAIGSFFIPIMNFFVPFVAMQQMVNGSFEKANKPTFHPLILLWWLCFIGSSILDRVHTHQSKKLDAWIEGNESDIAMLTQYFHEMAQLSWEYVPILLLSMVSAWALWVIIIRTTTLHNTMFTNNNS